MMKENSGKPVVLMDLDGVLRDWIQGLINVYRRAYPDHDIREITSRRLEEFFPIQEKIYDFIDQQYLEEILEEAPAYPGAVEAVQKWEGTFETVIVTAQPPSWRFATFVWIGKHRVATNQIVVTRQKHLCAGLALLDDFVENLRAFRDTGRLAVCLDQPWNRHWDGPRVKTVDEYYQLVLDFVRKNERSAKNSKK